MKKREMNIEACQIVESSQDQDGPKQLRIAMVVTRDIEASLSRLNTMRGIRNVFNECGSVSVLRLQTIFESRAWLDIFLLPLRVLVSSILGKPLPLQVLLFGGRSETARILNELSSSNYDLIYFDTVRCLKIAKRARWLQGNPSTIIDLDDLLSRRACKMLEMGRSLSLSQYANRTSGWVRSLLSFSWIARMLTAYEQLALREAEREAVSICDAATLVSAHEVGELRASLPPTIATRVHAILPPISSKVGALPQLASPVRFVFIGPDTQAQNELAIELLLSLWRQCRPQAELHIYGHQNLPWPEVDNVKWHGRVEDLKVVYDPTSLVVAPFSFPGGIKTKIIEAWSFGRPVLCTSEGLEGMEFDSYSLGIAAEQWPSLIRSPEDQLEVWRRAQQEGLSFVKAHTSSFSDGWRTLVHKLSTFERVRMT